MSRFDFNHKVLEAQASPIRLFKGEIDTIEGLIDLTLGQPDFHAPDIVHEAAHRAIDNNADGYTSSMGLVELREAISEYLKRHNDLTYALDEIIVTNGATGALFSAIYALLNPGDKVLFASPHYPVYQTIINLAHGETIAVDVSESDFVLTVDQIRQARKEHGEIKVILLNYPSNPTGQSYTDEQLKDLADEIRGTNTLVISDEIYSELLYDHDHVSIAKYLPEQTIVLNGVSKSHAMTGWRSGFIAAPKEIMDQIFKVNQASINTLNTVTQYASLAAYSEAGDQYIYDMRDEYKRRRDYLKEEMSQLGFATSNPSGAFYLFAKIPAWYEGSDYDFCLELAQEAKIGVIPGSSFGEAGSGFFRLSYAASQEKLEQFIQHLKGFVESHK